MSYCLSETLPSSNIYLKTNIINSEGYNLNCKSVPCVVGFDTKRNIDCDNFDSKKASDFGCSKVLVTFDEKNDILVTPKSFSATCNTLQKHYLQKPVVKKTIVKYVKEIPVNTITRLDSECFEKPIIYNSFKLSSNNLKSVQSLNKTLHNSSFTECLHKYNYMYNISSDIDKFITNAKLSTQLFVIT